MDTAGMGWVPITSAVGSEHLMAVGYRSLQLGKYPRAVDSVTNSLRFPDRTHWGRCRRSRRGAHLRAAKWGWVGLGGLEVQTLPSFRGRTPTGCTKPSTGRTAKESKIKWLELRRRQSTVGAPLRVERLVGGGRREGVNRSAREGVKGKITGKQFRGGWMDGWMGVQVGCARQQRGRGWDNCHNCGRAAESPSSSSLFLLRHPKVAL